MSLNYNGEKVTSVVYNGKKVQKIFYNGTELNISSRERFKFDKTSIKQSEMRYECQAGQASVNLYSGRLLFEHNDMKIGANSFLISVSHIYSSKWNQSNLKVGKGWRLNVNQRCFPYKSNEDGEALGFRSGNYVYEDSLGYIHRFIWYKKIANEDADCYYDATGSMLKLKVYASCDSVIEDGTGNKLLFDATGNLRKIISGINGSIAKKFEYDENEERLLEIYDERKPNRKLIFNYFPNKMLESIVCQEAGEIKRTINYYYDEDKNFVCSTITVDNQTKENVRFTYKNNRLIYAVHIETKAALKFDYAIEDLNLQIISVLKGIAGIEEGVISMPQSKVKQKSEFFYENEESTIVSNEKNIQTIYFFNNKGFTTSVFEKEGNNYRTLVKTSGWKLLDEGLEGTQINGEKALRIANGTYQIPNAQRVALINELSKEKHVYNQKFVISFWLYSDESINRNSKAKIAIKTRSTKDVEHELEFGAFLDSNAKKAWQYVTIPIDFELSNYNKKGITYSEEFVGYDVEEFKKKIDDIKLFLEGVSSSGIQIADLRIALGSQGNFVVANKNFDVMRSLRYFTETETLVGAIGNDFFLTENDLMQTYKSMYIERKNNPNAFFDLTLCDGTKVIKVKRVDFCIENETLFHSLAVDGEGIPNYCYQSKDKTAGDNWVITENQIRFDDVYMEQKIAVDIIKKYYGEINEEKSSKNYNWTRYNGLPHAKKDAYNVITENFYDGFGNLERVEIYNEKHQVTERIINRIEYDETDHRLRENIKNTIANGINYQETYKSPFMQMNSSGIYKSQGANFHKKYEYDHFGEKIVSVKVPKGRNVLEENVFSYCENGRISRVGDQSGRNFEFIYNEFGDINSYGVGENGIYREILNKQYTYNDTHDNNKSKIIESYILDNGINQRQTILSKYGTPETISENGKETKYNYQSIKESQSIAKIQSIVDPYDNQIYTYQYNDDNMPCGYETSGSIATADKLLKVRQIGANKTQYTIQDSEDHNRIRTSTIVYEDEEVKSGSRVYLSPRIYRTIDVDNGFGANEKKAFEFTYEYDALGRMINKNCENQATDKHTQIIEFQKENGIGSNQIKKLKHSVSYNKNYYHSYFTSYDSMDFDNDYEVSYDDKGNVSNIKEKRRWVKRIGNEAPINETISENSIEYSYDSLNQIKQEKNSKLNLNREYQYESGNLKSIINNNLIEREFTYHDNGQLKTKTDSNGLLTYTYDNYGNVNKIVTGINTTNLTWERNNLLSSYGNHKYSYNHQGIRCKKEVDGIIKYYYMDGNRVLGEDWSSGIKPRYFYDANGLAGIRVNSINYNFLLDITGSVRKIFKSGKLVCEYDYDLFGKCKITTYDDVGEEVISNNHIGHINPFRWKSYYFDDETGLYMLTAAGGTKYYDPETGRFINADISQLNPFAIDGLNLYNIGNPLKFPPNRATCFPSLPLSPEFSASSGGTGWKWWDNLDIGWKIALGIGVIAGLAALTVVTGGIAGVAAGGTFWASGGAALTAGFTGATVVGTGALATTATIAGAAFGGAVIASASGAIFGGLNGGWQGAVDGFALGAITGAISGGLGAHWSNAGKWVAQGFINSGISVGVKIGESLLTGSQINGWALLATAGFGFVGGAIGAGSWGEGWRNVFVGIGLGGSEDGMNYIFNW